MKDRIETILCIMFVPIGLILTVLIFVFGIMLWIVVRSKEQIEKFKSRGVKISTYDT